MRRKRKASERRAGRAGSGGLFCFLVAGVLLVMAALAGPAVIRAQEPTAIPSTPLTGQAPRWWRQ